MGWGLGCGACGSEQLSGYSRCLFAVLEGSEDLADKVPLL